MHSPSSSLARLVCAIVVSFALGCDDGSDDADADPSFEPPFRGGGTGVICDPGTFLRGQSCIPRDLDAATTDARVAPPEAGSTSDAGLDAASPSTLEAGALGASDGEQP